MSAVPTTTPAPISRPAPHRSTWGRGLPRPDPRSRASLHRRCRCDRLEGLRSWLAFDLDLQVRFPHDDGLGSRQESLRRVAVPVWHGSQFVRCAAHRHTAVNCNGPLSQRACAAWRARVDRLSRRDAGGDPKRRTRSLGDSASWPVHGKSRGPLASQHPRLPPDVLWTARTERAQSPFAIVILTIMVVPIISSISRELFLSVPSELEEGALALGATRWEMVRGVILPSARSGIAAAMILGLGRALGEAIAVTQVIGGATAFHASWFAPADTLASKVAGNYQSASTRLEASSLIYLAAILLVIGLLVNIVAQVIVRRFDPARAGGAK